MAKIYKTIFITLIFLQVICGQSESIFSTSDSLHYLNIPKRPENAIEGSDFVNQVTGLSITDREKAVVREILSGNVPSFSRKLRSLKINQTINAKSYELIFFTVCDYMAIGSDYDYLYIPMTPSTAQFLADKLNCSLPTKKIVDSIYTNAEIKLSPQPIPPSAIMTTIPVFKQHTDSIKQQITQMGFDRAVDNIIAGHKKDIIISNKIYSPDRDYERVVIYGWHLSENNPIQPVYNGHIATYADYSHGVRLISKLAFINGDSSQVDEILIDSNLSALLSSEGIINKPYYPESDIFTSVGNIFKKTQIDFKLSQNYPNPFNPTTRIDFVLAKPAIVKLSVYNSLAQKVAVLVNGKREMGNHSTYFNAEYLAAGIYYYRLITGDFSEVKKMILIK